MVKKRKDGKGLYRLFIPEGGGSQWRDNNCGRCIFLYRRKVYGHGPREECKTKHIARGVASEKIAEEHFKKLGFSVKRVDTVGPDLICSIGDGWKTTVEVKTVCRSEARGVVWWHVNPVLKNRRSDDLVAFVLPNERVYIDSMKNHLRHCHKNGTGSRVITAIVREFGQAK